MASGMTLSGWIFLALSWSLIFGVTVWCFVKLLLTNKSEN